MNPDMIAALRELEREKGIAFQTILAGLEEAMASAYKSWWKQQHPDLEDESFGVRASIDPESGDLRVWIQEVAETEEGEPEVVSEKEVEVTDEFKGRIGAQTAKQVIFQKLRDAEREMTYEEFAGREGDVVTGIVQAQERDRRSILLDLGKVEALLPHTEQIPSEQIRHGERVKAYITEVRRGTKGPQVVVSRSHPGLLRKLFEMEVPEIEEGIVEIREVAREPGHRSKIAVASREPAVDPVGACVGPKGSRVRMVVNELRGEKIDVVPWSADPAQFVANALQPAKVKEVITDPTTQTAMVVVPDYQLSLAIGKEGQNARLAARLTGWRIDIRSETQHAEELRAPRAAIPAVEEVPPEPRAVVEPELAPAANDEKKAGAEETPPVQVDDEVASVEPAPAVVEETVEG
ncbi:MAG TPA: transcription termination factor NusA [Actinomycetota bacterium]|jgi:N utilization substance protein A